MGCLAIVMIAAAASSAHAQSGSITGSISAVIDALPNVPRSDVVGELRLRAIADARIDATPWLRFRLAGVADGLAADRNGTVRDARADALDVWVEASGARADIRAGVGRLTWGRLDEIQPTDVINPIDVARFLLEGRSEARLPVAFVRARFIPSERLTVEGVIAPFFRAGTFDRLDEPTSPFNLLRDIPAPACPPGAPCPALWTFVRQAPEGGVWQGGGRVAVTTGRVDWSVSAWSGFTPFALVGGIEPSRPAALTLVHPRYTMYGADLETVTGKWAWRAEAAWFPDRTLQIENEPATFEGASFEGGAGLDRRAGDYTLSGTVLFRRSDVRARAMSTDLVYRSGTVQNVSLVAGFSRTYNRDRIETRVFTLVNPKDEAGFLRGVLSWKPVDDVAVETSIGWFMGEGDDVITRFGDRDFGYIRLKYFFGR